MENQFDTPDIAAHASDIPAPAISPQLLEELLCPLNSLQLVFLFWDNHSRRVFLFGDSSSVKPLENLGARNGEPLDNDSPLTGFIDAALARRCQVDITLAHEDGLTGFVTPIWNDSGQRLGALVCVGADVKKAQLVPVLKLAATAVSELHSARDARRAHYQAVQLISQILSHGNDATVLLDTDFSVMLISPAAVKLLGLENRRLDDKLDDVLEFRSGELSSYCDGQVLIGQIVFLQTPRGMLRANVDFHPISLGTDTHLGTLLSVRACTLAPTGSETHAEPSSLTTIVGKSEEIVRAKRSAVAAAKLATSVLIEGPKGSGKELFAREIHRRSRWRDGPFVVVDCTTIPVKAINAELFGYANGPLTASISGSTMGAIEFASNGTLYINEVGQLPKRVQLKLIKATRARQFAPIGASSPSPMNVRIIASTSEPLSHNVRSGQFRGDLYYDLALTHIRLPPLKERLGDIRELVEFFRQQFVAKHELGVDAVSSAAFKLLMSHSWPGNIDELKNVLNDAFAACKRGEVKANHLPSHFREKTGRSIPGFAADPLADERRQLRESEKLLYYRALEITSWNISAAAKLLGVSRASLYRKISKLRVRRS